MANDLSKVPIVIVNKSNFLTVWPSIIHAIDKASFIGIDIELSGLGERKSLMLKNIEDRYTAVAEIAKSRAILSLGIACFNALKDESNNEDDTTKGKDDKQAASTSNSYTSQIFDVSLLCMNEYVVEPMSLQFLVCHGFDFNQQYSKGLSYNRGNDDENSKLDQPSVRNLFSHLVTSKKKVVVHNGFLDLLFLYQNLYAQLPTKLEAFTADLREMFEGIYDTKYVAEFCLHYKASYLEYIFKRLQRLNDRRRSQNQDNVRIQFLNYHSSFDGIDFDDLRSIPGKPKSELCAKFASHGWCHDVSQCTKSHDVDHVLDKEENVKKKKKKKAEEKDEDSMEIDTVENSRVETTNVIRCETEDSEVAENPKNTRVEKTNEISCNMEDSEVAENPKNAHAETINFKTDDSVGKRSLVHRAGYDAFMTAYSLLVYYATSTPQMDFNLSPECQEAICNRIYLCGKDQPLIVQKGNFAKNSKNHKKKRCKH